MFFNASIKHAKGSKQKLLNLRHVVTSKCSGITLMQKFKLTQDKR